jgi:hypothetical protein
MILAGTSNVLPMLAVIIALGIVFIMGFAALKFFRFFSRAAETSLQRIYEEVGVTETPPTNGVHVVFHTYYGLLAWFTQTEHRAVLPLNKAEELLRRLNRFNFTWGFFAYGAIIIPLFSYTNYLLQLRKIRAEYRSLGSVKNEIDSTLS